MKHDNSFTMYDEWLIRVTLSELGFNDDNETAIIDIIERIKPRIKNLRLKK